MVSKCQVRIRVHICIRHLLASIQISSKDLRLDPAPDPDPLFKFFCLVFFQGTFTSVHSSEIKSHKERSHKTVEIKGFLTFLLGDGRIWIHTNNDGSGWPENLRIRIHNTEEKTDRPIKYLFSDIMTQF